MKLQSILKTVSLAAAGLIALTAPGLIALTALAFATAARAQQAVVDTDFAVQAAARGAILWDVRSEEEYKKGHIPGAINFDDPQTQLRDGKTEDYLPIPQMEKLLGGAGIDPGKEIVVYGSKALPSAYFAYQTLRYLGAQRAHVYHGGFDDWKAAGKAVTSERTTLPPVEFDATLDKQLLVSTQDVVSRLNRSGVQILDVRTGKEFSGDDMRALRGGRIPGAVNIPYESNWLDPDTPRKLQRKQVNNKDGMALKPRDALKELYAALDPEQETIVYCQSGSRASETATVLQDLGFKNVKIYDGSWLAWGNTFDAPVENVSYFNVGRVNGLLNQLQGRVDALEAEVDQLKSAAAKKQ
jgi:thiosulfate/3-mercaptopyruvate sulfurtransferase